ncbi:hypothetical protein PTKIN_Ptkin09bG0145000 [Pterospermum kingtungense]
MGPYSSSNSGHVGAVEECFTKNDIVFANRFRLLITKHLAFNYTALSWAPYGDHWRNLRRIASLELLSTNRLQLPLAIRLDEVKSLMRKLLDHQDEAVEFKRAFFELTFNVMMRMIAGKRYYGCEKEEEMEEARRKLERRLMECGRKRYKFMQDLIEQHRRKKRSDAAGEWKKTMIKILLSMQESESEYYTDEIIRGLMLELKLQLTLWSGLIHFCLTTQKRLKRLRLKSSTPWDIRGFRVPCGTMLLVNIWAIQNDPKIFKEPTRFKPERFEGLEGARDGFKLMPFGAGRRGCPGEGLGLRIVGLTLGSLIQCFEWSRVGDEMVDMRAGTGFTMPKAHPLQAHAQPCLNFFLKFERIWPQVCLFHEMLDWGKRI